MEKQDVVIVGSGAAGSLLAAKLSQGGKRVLILEAGPEHTTADLYSSQLWARRIKWSGSPVETGGKHPISIAFASGWGTGGAALHHYAVWLRLHPEDFALHSRYGKGQDWPLTYEELRPFYDQVQKEVGVSGDAQAEVWRPAGDPYPMPPRKIFRQATLIAEGFSKLGLRTCPLPMAINSVMYNGRPPCDYNGWCDAGCAILALGNPLAVYLPQAQKAGTRILHNSFVTRLLTDVKGRRVSGVEYYDAQGQRHVQEASVVVLAAYAIQNPRVLLNSRTDKHPEGLANSSGLVGKYMMTHTAGNVYGLFQEETENYMGTTGGQLLSQENYKKDPRRSYVNSSSWLIANALKPNDLLGIVNSRAELFGDALHDFLKTASHRLATMSFVGEDLPAPDNRLVLSDKKDRYGMPLARVTHSSGPESMKCYQAGMEQGQAIFRAAGGYEVWRGPRASMHTLGGVIMGRSRQASVTDSYGQTHDIPNLFVAGSSLFPTSGAVNPTFTIHALALRTSKHLLDKWSTLS
jgi:choline dehydrogenase-like flavoprotein